MALSVVGTGDAEVLARLNASLGRSSWPPVTVAWQALPSQAPPIRSYADVEANVNRAHAKYVGADFGACLDAVEGDDLVPRLVADANVPLAARVLLWRIACHVGAGETSAAERDARSYALFGFEGASDLDRVTPEVARVLDAQRRSVAHLATASYRIESSEHVAVRIDASTQRHVLPDTVQLPIGQHLVQVFGPGYVPEWRFVNVPATGDTLRVTPVRASPSVAAAEWSARYGENRDVQEIDTAPSLELLAQALSARKLVIFTVEKTTLRAALVADGVVSARAERTVKSLREVDDAGTALLRALLERGGQIRYVPPLVRRPGFWIGIAGGAVVAAGVSLAIALYPRSVKVSF